MAVQGRERVSRILLLCAELGGIGGVERLIATLSPLLAQRHEVYVASFDPPGTAPGMALSVPFHSLGGGDDGRAPALRVLTYLSQVRRLRRLERALAIDITISNLWRADLISALARGRSHRIALAHINVVGNPTNRLMIRLRPLVAAVYRRFDRVVTVSHALARELSALYRLDPTHVRTIWNPVARPAFAPSPATPARIVWCGRMVREKNVRALIQAFAAARTRHPSVSLHLIGDGPERGAITAVAANLGLLSGPPESDAPVILHGRLTDPSAVIAGAALLALPSIAEGFGLVLVEAMACGVPVLAADCASGGVHEVLAARSPHDPGRSEAEEVSCGWLLPVPTDEATRHRWTTALDTVLSDPSRRETYRTGALARAADFGADHILVQWEALLSEMTA